MIAPSKINAAAKKVEDENLRFRTFLKGHIHSFLEVQLLPFLPMTYISYLFYVSYLISKKLLQKIYLYRREKYTLISYRWSFFQLCAARS